MKVQWLKGTWHIENFGESVYEKWQDTGSPGSLKGIVYSLKDSDSVDVVQITLESKADGSYYYTPHVIGASKCKTVPFKVVVLTDSLLTVRNNGTDYPQEIKYKLNGDGTILASISGKLNGKDQVENFPMQRVGNN